MCGNWSFGVWHDGWPHPVVWTAGQYLPPFRCEFENTMSKSKKTDMPGDGRGDDVSGLFARLGLASADDGYRDFSRERLRTVTASPVPAASDQAAAATSGEAVPASRQAAQSAVQARAVAAVSPDVNGRPLRALFEKILAAGDAADIDKSASPLRKLRASN